MLCDFMGVMFLVYPADAPNKRGEDKQASIKKAWAMHGINGGLLKKSTLLSSVKRKEDRPARLPLACF